MGEILSVKEVVQWLGVPAPTLYLWCREGHLPHKRLGRRIVFTKQTVEAWLHTSDNKTKMTPSNESRGSNP
ncbi:MAG TPA: helix-turn-helix domain-containing protein [Clostridia bacterium]|nr:helix-turn-helix domain-containing protein [Clostridia bacterium]